MDSLLETLLRKLEEAVVETHQKHSSLLEMTNNEAAMDSLLETLLRKLEEAVVETHQKHSSLLEMTNNEAAMDSLLETLSPEACDNLRDAGITSLEHLLHLTKGPEKSGPFDSSKLKEYGITDAVDLNRIETFLIKPGSQEAGGSGQPAGDYDQKREQLLEDMSSLREKLDLKKERLMAEFPDENTTQNDQKQIKHKALCLMLV
jgi:hypothetical protein